MLIQLIMTYGADSFIDYRMRSGILLSGSAPLLLRGKYMFNEVVNIILDCAEGAFLEVGAFVGAVLLLFGYVNFKTSGNFVSKIEKSKKWQPVIGALLGLSPGCGGAIFVMPLFVKRIVSFGTVIAALIATMGDSAFVIISVMPINYIIISLISLSVAIITGYIVDYFKIGEKLSKRFSPEQKKHITDLHASANHNTQCRECKLIENYAGERVKHIGHTEGDEIDIALHHKAKGHQSQDDFGYKFTHNAYKIFWVFISIGLILGIMLLAQIDVNSLAIPNLGMVIGISGTLFSVIMMILGKKYFQDDTHEEEEFKLMSLKETLIHNAEETAFVITWVFVAYVIYELSIFAIGGGNHAAGEELLTQFMLSSGIWPVIIGALIGLIPGCGPQIIFVALFLKGLVPFAALAANAISQDGDALFPLLAIDKKSSLWATVITTIPAIIIGVILYYADFLVG